MKRILAYLLPVAMLFAFVACPNNADNAAKEQPDNQNTDPENQNTDPENPGSPENQEEGDEKQALASGTKISDFSGHSNSLDWFVGTFVEDGGEDYPNDKWVITDTTIELCFGSGENAYSNKFNIKSIAYNSEEKLIGSYNAPAGSWAFTVISDDDFNDEYTYVIEKSGESSFYATISTLSERGMITRTKVKS